MKCPQGRNSLYNAKCFLFCFVLFLFYFAISIVASRIQAKGKNKIPLRLCSPSAE